MRIYIYIYAPEETRARRKTFTQLWYTVTSKKIPVVVFNTLARRPRVHPTLSFFLFFYLFFSSIGITLSVCVRAMNDDKLTPRAPLILFGVCAPPPPSPRMVNRRRRRRPVRTYFIGSGTPSTTWTWTCDVSVCPSGGRQRAETESFSN